MRRPTFLYALCILASAFTATLAMLSGVAAASPIELPAPAAAPDGSPTFATFLTATPEPTSTPLATSGPSPTLTAAPSPTPTIEPGGCRAFGDKSASEQVYLGETTRIALTIRAVCAGWRRRVHVMLVMDGSADLQGQPNQQMREAATTLVRDLDLEDYPSTKVGVVEFNTEARRLCDLMNDEERLVRCIRRVDAEGDTSIEAGLAEAQKLLRRGRIGVHPREGPTEIVVLFSGGDNDARCEEAARASWRLRGDGVLIISICVGRACNEHCMRQLASSPRYYFRVENAGALLGVFQQIRDRILNVNLRRVTVTDKLPANMRYIEGSANPAPMAISPERDQLTWEDIYIPMQGVTYTFEVEPLETGVHATNVEAHADLVANTGWEGTFVFPVPTVEVRVPPTPTTSYVANPTPSRTPTATPMLLPPPTPTAEAASRQAWLPFVRQRSE